MFAVDNFNSVFFDIADSFAIKAIFVNSVLIRAAVSLYGVVQRYFNRSTYE